MLSAPYSLLPLRSTLVTGYLLRSGTTQSCGCLVRQKVIEASTTHGYAARGRDRRTYQVWCGMIARCTNPNNKAYPNYGGRGITIDPRWLEFSNFLADMGEPPLGLTIERIDVNGNYEPDNCRWATRKEQANNKTKHHRITYQGITRNLSE